jgi:hypothetical protein
MGGWVERRGEDWLEMLILTPQDMICKIVAFCQNTVCCQPNVHHYEPSRTVPSGFELFCFGVRHVSLLCYEARYWSRVVRCV